MKHTLSFISFIILASGCSSQPDVNNEQQIQIQSKIESEPSIESPDVLEQDIEIKPNTSRKIKKATKRINKKKSQSINTASFSGNYLDKTYEIIFERLTWKEANAKANERGATLACLDTRGKLKFIRELRQDNNHKLPVWVGLTDHKNEGQWQWVCGGEFDSSFATLFSSGTDFETRDFAHLTRLNKSSRFIPRNNNGDRPSNIRGASDVQGYIIEYNKQVQVANIQPDPVDEKYKALNPELFVKLLEARELIQQFKYDTKVLSSAEDILENILEQNNAFAPAYLEQAKAIIKRTSQTTNSFFSRKELKKAEQSIYQSIRAEPNYAAAYLILSEMLLKTYRYDESESALRTAISLEANTIDTHLQKAHFKYKKRRYSSAKFSYQQVMDSVSVNNPKYKSALMGMSAILVREKMFLDAEEANKKLIDLFPNDDDVWGNYASFLFYTLNDIDGAIEKGRKAMTIHDNSKARFTLANALFTKWEALKGDEETKADAEKYFAEGFSFQPNIKLAIQHLNRQKFTQDVATELQKWLIENDEINEPPKNI